jgi:rhodanese-related sulfurtransferase
MKINFFLFLLFSLFSTFICAEELGLLTSEQFKAMQKNTNALVIDIRTEKEWDSTGVIPNSHKLQFFSPSGTYDTNKWLSALNQLKTSNDQTIILVCRSGSRSGKVGDLLTKQLGMNNIHHLSNGIMSWINAGNEITKECTTKLACK